jgi:hypothetical protein
MAVVALRQLLFFALLTNTLQALRRAETGIGMAVLDQLAGIFLIDGLTIALAVRAVRATHVWAFVPMEAQPTQALFEFFFGAGHETFLIGILNPEDKLTAGLTGKQIVV